MGALKSGLMALVVGLTLFGATPKKAEAYSFGSYAYDIAYDTYAFALYGVYDDINYYGGYTDYGFYAYYYGYYGYVYAEYAYFYDFDYFYDAYYLLYYSALYSEYTYYYEVSSFYFLISSIYGYQGSNFSLYAYYYGFYGY